MTHREAQAQLIAESRRQLSLRALDTLGKGLGDLSEHPRLGDLAGLGWNLLAEDVSLPVAVLSESRLAHNLAWMNRFIAAYGLKLAPHGKTTMSPGLFQRQLQAGAWGITLATAPQVQAAYNFGVRRVILANQLLGRANMAIIARLMRDPEFQIFVLLDSPANAARLGEFFASQNLQLPVLIELGVTAGRTGVRNQQQLDALLAEIARWPQSLQLSGLEVYEGVLKDEASIRAFLRRAAQCLQQLVDDGLIASERALLTGAGSAWYDLVAEEWAPLQLNKPLDVVLRPGCYLTHDLGIYKASAERIQANNSVAKQMQSGLLPALQLWAYVQSRPEPELVILGLGKRDAAFDAGLPVPALHYRPDNSEQPRVAPENWQLTKMMDQHAYMQVPADADVQVGDMLALDISHPCLTFDKWRQLLIVDDHYQVIDAVETFF